jgi:hypothetical protein
MKIPALVEPGRALTVDEVRRYSRHLIIPDLAMAGQARLMNAKVLCVGAGGLGSPALMYLAAAGVGTIGIAEFDTVDESNLQRQIIHGQSDIGKSKAKSAQEKIAEINPAKGEYVKAVLPTPDGYSPEPIVPSVTDEVINEKDLVFVDAPNGWVKDENYKELGDNVEKYVDSANEFAVYISKQDDGAKEYKIVNAASDEEIDVVLLVFIDSVIFFNSIILLL